MKVKRGEVQRQIAGGGRAPAKADERDLTAMSSLERVELLSELENKYSIDLNEEEFAAIKSRRELDEWLRRSAATPVTSSRPPSEWARSLPARAFRSTFQRLLAIPLFKHYLPLTVTGLEHRR